MHEKVYLCINKYITYIIDYKKLSLHNYVALKILKYYTKNYITYINTIYIDIDYYTVYICFFVDMM